MKCYHLAGTFAVHISAIFAVFKNDGRTDLRTDPLIEMEDASKKVGSWEAEAIGRSVSDRQEALRFS